MGGASSTSAFLSCRRKDGFRVAWTEGLWFWPTPFAVGCWTMCRVECLLGRAHSGSAAAGIRVPHPDALHPLRELDLNLGLDLDLEDTSRQRGIFCGLGLYRSDPAVPAVPAPEAAHGIASQCDHHMGFSTAIFRDISLFETFESKHEVLLSLLSRPFKLRLPRQSRTVLRYASRI